MDIQTELQDTHTNFHRKFDILIAAALAAVLTGEVCGLAAAEAVRLDTTPDALDVTDLQGKLKARNFLLDVGRLDDI